MDFSALRRHPDIDGPDLHAFDAADRLILDEAASAISTTEPTAIVVIDDNYGALTLGVVEATSGSPVRVHQDLITGERALALNAARLAQTDRVRSMPLTPDLIEGARLVLLRLPRSLDRLDELAGLIARHADPAVTIVAGGRIKHMSTTMNDVLRTHFSRVDVSHARQKSRVLTASGATDTSSPPWPRTLAHPEYNLTVAAHGGVFAGTKIDIGTRLLLDNLDAARPDARDAVDLACGSGVVATYLCAIRPTMHVQACDRSAAAVASTRLTLSTNGFRGRSTVTQADALDYLADGSVELIALNPPFHSDAALSTGIATHLFADAARALAPGGELWCVWNSHLRYRSTLQRLIGPTRQIARNAKFTVTASRRSDANSVLGESL